jgi:hypothetical protein
MTGPGGDSGVDTVAWRGLAPFACAGSITQILLNKQEVVNGKMDQDTKDRQRYCQNQQEN